MKPIRQPELIHYNDTINNKFAQKQGTFKRKSCNKRNNYLKKEKIFLKELKVEAKLKKAELVYKKYKKFVEEKDRIERELQTQVRKMAEEVENHLEQYSNARAWHVSFDGYDIRDEDPVEYFHKKINEARYMEAENHCTKNHKIRNILEHKKEYAKNILYSGGDINTVVSELKKAFEEAKSNLLYQSP